VTERVVVEADGGSRGNPGPAGYGAVVLDPASGAVLAERSEFIGTATNNVAEYQGLIAGLTAARELGARRVAVRMDSKLVVEQMSGRWQVKHPAMRPLAREAAELRQAFDEVTFDWIPRAQNAYADRLANEAMDRAAGKPVRAAAERAAPPATGTWVPPTGPPTRLLLVRHGSTVHSAERRFSGRNDLPLDETGEVQAGALADRLGSRDDVAAVVSSPLTRAVQTADAIAARLGLDVTTVDGFAEVDFGDFEGLTAAEARDRYPEAFAAWSGSIDVAPPHGESFAALATRVRRAREAVLAEHPEQVVVVVTHVTPIKTLVRLALDAPPVALFRSHLDTASLSAVDYFADGSSSLRLFNDTAHLS
jgi:broad specificity phosphatase PhoE/ribonuclease HI